MLNQLHIKLREIRKAKALKLLRAKYGNELPARTDDVCILLLRLTNPKLNDKKCSKYANVLHLVRLEKKPDETVKEFVRANGGMNGCEKKMPEQERKASGTKWQQRRREKRRVFARQDFRLVTRRIRGM
jgi:hypothetical protein